MFAYSGFGPYYGYIYYMFFNIFYTIEPIGKRDNFIMAFFKKHIQLRFWVDRNIDTSFNVSVIFCV